MEIKHEERMSDIFTKLHIQIGKFPFTLHHFTGPDQSDPHDHPYGFTSTILAGGYVEEVYRYNALGIRGWSRCVVRREVGQTFDVRATDVHRVIELPAGECVTMIRWHDQELRRESKVWRFVDGRAEWRWWHSEEWHRHDVKFGL